MVYVFLLVIHASRTTSSTPLKLRTILRRILALRGLLSSSQNLLLLQQFRQLPILVHADQDITTADELLVNIQLRDRGPVGILLDPLSQLRVFENVESGELVRIDALQTKNLDAGARETALWCLGGSLHEKHDGCGGNGFVDRLARLIRQETALGEGESGGDGLEAEDGGGSGWPKGLY